MFPQKKMMEIEDIFTEDDFKQETVKMMTFQTHLEEESDELELLWDEF